MDTYFAPAKKLSDRELEAEIEIVSQSSVLDGLLCSISGLLAILNDHRQLVALNAAFLDMLGVDNAEDVLGLRPGEALQCIHAGDDPSGCGTTKYCSTCGAAVAIVASICENRPAERICALSIDKGDRVVDKALLVRSHPITIDREKLILLFLQDITKQQQRAALERTFFHDVNNLVNMLAGASELLVREAPSELAETIHQASLRIIKEIAIQQNLLDSEAFHYQPMWHRYSSAQIIEEIRSFFTNHPAARGKHIYFADVYPVVAIETDISLLSRVLCNMIINALEATEENGSVRVGATSRNGRMSFCVWNAGEIPTDIVRRIFQRNFSTKAQAGRGVGTFSMKLFGEGYLGGKVDFTTSASAGTVFRITLPLTIGK
jgi:signal transduction histidine kinase